MQRLYPKIIFKRKMNMTTKLKSLTLAICLLSINAFAQTGAKEYTAGHIFYVTLPDYMKKTGGLNTAATIQFKNTVKDVYGFIIEDNKEELGLVDMSYASIDEFYEDFIKDFASDEEKRKVTKPQSLKKGETNFVECDVTYYDKEAKSDIYYFIGIAETKAAYYKVLCWATVANKDKYKADFQKILYSIRD
ncbi:MAG: hypothetical protein ABI723_01830 [Bacteroidia bacterium]